MENDKAHQIIDHIINGLSSLKEALGEPKIAAQSLPSEFESLKKALLNNKWPEAVNTNIICDPNNEFDKIERARGILELMVEESIKGKKFLDYGCGEGHVTKIAIDYAPALAAGYDIKTQWPDGHNLLISNSINIIEQHKPYDIILIHDVIDHIENEHPINLLKKAKLLLSDNGKIYIRCHPYTSRHATHSYHTLNKAYIHLVFENEELLNITSDIITNFGVIDHQTYNRWFEEVGLKVEKKNTIDYKIDPFFKIPKIASKINKRIKGDLSEVQFIDWCLSKQ